MGNKTTENPERLGDIILQDHKVERAILPCSFSGSAEFDAIVHDKQGRSVISKTFQVDMSTRDISFDISSLKPGIYHVWLYFKDGTVVKEFEITNPAAEETGFMDKISGLFKRFNLFLLTITLALESPLHFLQSFVEV